MWKARKHERSWEGAAPKFDVPESDAGCGVQPGYPCVGAAFELFFFLDSCRLGSIHTDLASIRVELG